MTPAKFHHDEVAPARTLAEAEAQVAVCNYVQPWFLAAVDAGEIDPATLPSEWDPESGSYHEPITNRAWPHITDGVWAQVDRYQDERRFRVEVAAIRPDFDRHQFCLVRVVEGRDRAMALVRRTLRVAQAFIQQETK